MIEYIILLLIIILLYYYHNRPRKLSRIIRLYKPGCQACKNSQAEWDKFYLNHSMHYPLSQVDITNGPPNEVFRKLMIDAKVQSVPMVLAVFTDETTIEYTGERTSEAYEAWAKKLL